VSSEPRTEAGRALLSKLDAIGASPLSGVSFPDAEDDIRRIEDEARDTAALSEGAAPEERGLDWQQTCNDEAHASVRYESERGYRVRKSDCMDCARLAATPEAAGEDPQLRLRCARHFGSDGTLCATHYGQFLSPTDAYCSRAATPAPTTEPEPMGGWEPRS
jgi:hypothetical protein